MRCSNILASRITEVTLVVEMCIWLRNIYDFWTFTKHLSLSLFFSYRSCFAKKIPDSILIVQSESGDQNEELIACARYSAQRELQEILQKGVKSKIYVIFLVQLTGLAGNYFSGYQVLIDI